MSTSIAKLITDYHQKKIRQELCVMHDRMRALAGKKRAFQRALKEERFKIRIFSSIKSPTTVGFVIKTLELEVVTDKGENLESAIKKVAQDFSQQNPERESAHLQVYLYVKNEKDNLPIPYDIGKKLGLKIADNNNTVRLTVRYWQATY